GREQPEYMHENTEPILKETFGVIIYQEQVMQIAQALSGYSLGEADMLRRAMGKKIKAEMDAQRARFVNGAVERGVAKAKADEIFELLAKFADYGFNKSHAAAYALISYWTAWYKANHAAEFLAASMTLDKGNTDKLAEFRADARRLEIRVAAPSVNRSGADFDVRYDAEGPTILYALGAIKGVGTAQAQAVAARVGGPYKSLADFARRVDPKQVNKKALECLAAAGAFDDIEPERAVAFASVEPMLGLANRRAEERQSHQAALFGDAPETQIQVKATPWPVSERLQREFDAIGFFLSGHPLEAHEAVIKRLGAIRWAEFCARVRSGETTHRLAANVLDKFERRTKAGKKMGIVQLSDPSGQYEVVMFEESLLEYRDLLEKGADVIVTLNARVEGEEVRAAIHRVEKLADAAARSHKGLKVFVRDETPLPSIAERLKARGDGQIKLVVILGPGEEEVEIELPGRFAVTGALAGALKAVAGVVQVEHV
ncbi:MAG TPA: OB-fold nucleic acid binding domain-containing protein, partial [Roseiarcus sp.]|nr:OB-fold nucleic acid binding domain-containing protein [Roseiarcus sp.]